MTLVEIPIGNGRVYLLGTVQGLASEAERVREAFERAAPRVVALGTSVEGVAGLLHHLRREVPKDEAARRALEEEAAEDLSDAEVGYGFGLSRYGKVLLPPRCLLEAVRIAQARDLPIEGADLTEEQYEKAFTTNVGAFALLRYSRRARKLAKAPPEASTALEFALAWDRALTSVKAYGAVERARETAIATRARDLAREHERVLLVVEAAREAGVAARVARAEP